MPSSSSHRPLPVAGSESGLSILKGLLADRSLLTALTLMNRYVGRAFKITLPRFQPAVFIGPDANRQILVSQREQLLWRPESDPVCKLLRQGVLVIDGDFHDEVRDWMDSPLQRRHVLPHIPAFWRNTDIVADAWRDGQTVDMLVEMRKVALLIIFDTLFEVDFAPDMPRLWEPIKELLAYISPGPWIFWADMPRPFYRRAKRLMDEYLYGLIAARRAALQDSGRAPNEGDLLGQLVSHSGMDDGLIRDQLLTMLIAGHDTSTALLAWVFTVLGQNPVALATMQAEVDAVIGFQQAPPSPEQLQQLVYSDQVIKETLRLYPPIHVGNRRAANDMELQGYHVPQDTRVMYSIYLAHRDAANWQDPESFCPERFDRQSPAKQPPFAYVPFGGGPRNCIGAAFAQIEAKAVLARLLQRFEFRLLNGDKIKPHMGATLEPRPGVMMQVRSRSQSD